MDLVTGSMSSISRLMAKVDLLSYVNATSYPVTAGFRFNIKEVEMGTRRPLVLQMMHNENAKQPVCRFQVRPCHAQA